ncbi:MAG: lipid A biosynthesis acyltransferase [Hyphomonadaceae bacterium]|nr:lipid A biosynthesis acyltransferase [Hyphomonadaceae bacterium]
MADNWEKQSERGTQFWVLFAAWLYKLAGRTVTLIIISPAILFYFFTGEAARKSSQAYLKRSYRLGMLDRKPSLWSSFHHFMTFAGSLIDKLAGWTGGIAAKDVEGADDPEFSAAKSSGRGGLVLTAHLGNPELIRAVATVENRFAVTVLMHTENAQNYNNVIKRFSPTSSVNIIEVSSIDVPTAMELSAAVERGEWVVMAADRLPPRDRKTDDAITSDFLGDTALFPVGPYVLASALKCPVYFLVCIRTRDEKPFRIIFRKIADQVTLPRRNRLNAIRGYAQTYVDFLTDAVKQAPYQWFNFYDYWDEFSARSGEVEPSDTIQAGKETAS